MMYSIHITSRAQRDIDEAADYIEFSLRNPQASDALLDAVKQEISSLSNMPERYPVVTDDFLGALGIRFVQVKNYLAFYRIDEKQSKVYVVRFLYGRRDWVSILHHDTIDRPSYGYDVEMQ